MAVEQNSKCTCLFDSNADSYRVDGPFYQNLLFIIPTDHNRLKQKLFTAPGEMIRQKW